MVIAWALVASARPVFAAIAGAALGADDVRAALAGAGVTAPRAWALTLAAAAAWAWAFAYASVITWAIARSRPRPVTTSGEPPARVRLVRPCAGADPALAEALASTAHARTRHALEVVIAVAEPTDPAWPLAEEAARGLRAAGLNAEARLTAARTRNAKCGQLAASIDDAGRPPCAVVLNADADVDLTEVSLDPLIDPLLSPAGPAATYAPPVEVAPSGALGDRASRAVLDASLHAFALLAGLDRAGLVGKLFAVRRSALDACGGFAALGDHLGEDTELARRLRARGERVEAAPLAARSLSRDRTWADARARYTRWMTVIRAQRPALLLTYPLLFFACAPLCALAWAGGAHGAAWLALTARFAAALAARHRSGRPWGVELAAAVVLADALLFAAWARALTSRTVVWRGRALTVGSDGRLRG